MAVGERAALRCPLKFMKEFGQYYRAVWRVGDRDIASTNPEQSLGPWAQLDKNTLTLTVGPFNSTLKLACVLLSFNRSNPIDFGNAAKGTVNIKLACKSCSLGPQYEESDYTLADLCTVHVRSGSTYSDICPNLFTWIEHGIAVQMVVSRCVHCMRTTVWSW